MPGKNKTSGISHSFCKEARTNGGILSTAYLHSVLKEKGKCVDCPNKGSVGCREHVEERIQSILSAQT